VAHDRAGGSEGGHARLCGGGSLLVEPLPHSALRCVPPSDTSLCEKYGRGCVARGGRRHRLVMAALFYRDSLTVRPWTRAFNGRSDTSAPEDRPTASRQKTHHSAIMPHRIFSPVTFYMRLTRVSLVNGATYQWSMHTVTWQTGSCQFTEV
jgi:hypothetical protein